MTQNSRLNYRHTALACYIGYITQAIVNNLAPLFFAAFSTQFNISVEKIGLIAAINFVTQICVDLACVKTIDRIGYRAATVGAHVFAVAGLVMLAILPYSMENSYLGIVIATVFNAIGGGLTEVVISPVIEALPGEQKTRAMSLLHSFYCWGVVAVVLLSTLFFACVAEPYHRYLPILWAIVPFFNIFFFAKVPLKALVEDGDGMRVRDMFKSFLFPMLLVMMLCAGASELAMGQWASMFAEVGLHVSKSTGDLLGPCLFALLQGVGRLLNGAFGGKRDIAKILFVSACFTVVCYLVTSLSGNAVVSLLGCAFTGIGISVMWPGTLSLASREMPRGGNSMFALLAFGGDVGASAGPWLLGIVAAAARAGEPLKNGMLVCTAFPVLMAAAAMYFMRRSAR